MDYPIPESIMKDRIILLSEISSAAEFINDMCLLEPVTEIKLLDLHKAYYVFCVNRGYKSLGYRNFKKAMELDTLNPRPEYLQGVGLYYTPEQFGGGPVTAKPLLDKSLDKYNQFVPDNDLMPIWGRRLVEQLLEQINEIPEKSQEE